MSKDQGNPDADRGPGGTRCRSARHRQGFRAAEELPIVVERESSRRIAGRDSRGIRQGRRTADRARREIAVIHGDHRAAIESANTKKKYRYD